MQSCIICLEESTNLNVINHCGVYYIHNKCYTNWIEKNNTCIVCREPLMCSLEEIEHREVDIERGYMQHSIYSIMNAIKYTVLYTITIVFMTTVALITLYIFV